MWLLTDPTPITEQGVAELGFERADWDKRLWSLGGLHAGFDDGMCALCGPNVAVLAKTLGQLRGLLLFVGE